MSRIKYRVVSLLRWSERYFKTDMLYLAKGGFWLACNQGIITLTGLILSVALANLVSKEVYGTYQFIMAMSVVLGTFTLTGMPAAVMRAAAQGNESALRTGFHTQLRWSIGVVFLAAGLAMYYFINDNFTLALSFLVVGAFTPFLDSFGLTKSYLVGKRLFRENALMGLWRRLIPLFAILATLFFTRDPLNLILVYFASNTLSAGLLYLVVVRTYSLPHTPQEAMVNYGKHLSILKIFSEVLGQADKVLIWVMLGAAPVAVYTLALLPVKQIESAFKLVYDLTFPKLVNTEFSVLKQTLARKARILLAVAGGLTILYIVAAPFLFKVLFPFYSESIALSQLLALTILAKPRSLYGQAFTAHHRRRQQYLMTVTSTLLRLSLLLALIPFYGIWGAAYALIGSQLYLNILTRYLFAKAQ